VPRTEIVFHRTADGQVPVREWLKKLRVVDAGAHARKLDFEADPHRHTEED
jgi:hypothetical protein